jgi:hypothetical protein
MGKTNAQRQADWRQRARDAREYQKRQQRQTYTPPAGYVLLPQRMVDWLEAEITKAVQIQQEPDGGVPEKLKSAYSVAAREAARHAVAYGLEVLAECGTTAEDQDPEQEESDRAGLTRWLQVFERPISDDVLLSIVEAAGARAGEFVPKETLMDILSRREQQCQPSEPAGTRPCRPRSHR